MAKRKNGRFRKIGILVLFFMGFHFVPKTVVACSTKTDANYWDWGRDFLYNVQSDYCLYYTNPDNYIALAGVFLVTGIMANTNIDNSIHHFWQKNIRSNATNSFFKFPAQVGQFNYIKVYLASSLLGYLGRNKAFANALYTWGDRALRTMLILSPQEVLVSWALGNGKPSQDGKSKWQFFGKGGKNGCSGHAFNGAVPFFTAAMMTEDPLLRYGLYTLGLLPGIARINSDSHYLSQVLMGWALVYLAGKAVVKTDEIQGCTTNFNICPLKDGVRLSASIQF